MLQAPSLGELLARAAREAPESPAFRYRREFVTYADWDRLADRLAARFYKDGVRQGDVVALWLPSTPLYPIAYLAAARLGAVTTGINVRYRGIEAGHILRQSGAKLLLHVDRWHGADLNSIVDRLSTELSELETRIPVGADLLAAGTANLVQDVSAGCDPAPPASVSGADPVAIVFTSGTTGVPKGATYTHANVLALAEIETRRYADGRIPFAKHLAAGLSFAHVGTMARIAVQIGHGGLSIVHDTFDPGAVLEEIEREKLVHIGGIPTQIILLLDHPDRSRRDISSLRSLLLGGAASSPALLRRIAAELDVTISVRYSSTEVGIATSSLPDDSLETLVSTVGKPTEGVELRIVDADNVPCAAGSSGEVVVRSPATMRGYWRAAEATDAVIDKEGWVHTGDVGWLDAEGYLHLKGRKSDMYIRGGFNVHPEEVENVLAKHPKVARAAIVGAPDVTLGEIGWAFVVPRDAHDPPTLEELRACVGEAMASFKRPDRLTVVDSLPVTPMFKVDKRDLRERLRQV